MSIVLALALSTSQVPIESNSMDCDSAISQAELNHCSSISAAKIEAALDESISVYMRRLSPEQSETFAKSQAAWRTYRESACAFEASTVESGSAYSLAINGCYAAFAQKRLEYLQSLIACEEGDINCPAPREMPN